MGKIQREKLRVATMATEWRKVVTEYGLGVELNQFCSAANMDEPRFAAMDKEVREQLSDVQDRSIAFHGPFNELFPAAIDPKALQLAHDRYQQAWKLAVSYGADKMILHTGYVPKVYFKEWHLEKSCSFWAGLIQEMGGGIFLHLENVMDDEPYMLRHLMEGIEEILSTSSPGGKSGGARICLDLGHVNCVSKVGILEWIRVLSPYLGHVHLHNNDGNWDDHGGLDEGSMDVEAALWALLEIGMQDLSYTIESRDCRRSVEWLLRKRFL